MAINLCVRKHVHLSVAVGVVRHTLRHTAITHLVQAGVDLPTVKRISGHKTLIMVERYAHQNGAHIQAAMDALEARYTVHPPPTAQRQ
jgi:integrase